MTNIAKNKNGPRERNRVERDDSHSKMISPNRNPGTMLDRGEFAHDPLDRPLGPVSPLVRSFGRVGQKNASMIRFFGQPPKRDPRAAWARKPNIASRLSAQLRIQFLSFGIANGESQTSVITALHSSIKIDLLTSRETSLSFSSTALLRLRK